MTALMCTGENPNTPGCECEFCVSTNRWEGMVQEKETDFRAKAEADTSDNWQHRSRRMRCSSCMWWVPKEAPEGQYARGSQGGALGRCRRRAPTLNGWPAVFATDWCGDHKLDENRQ